MLAYCQVRENEWLLGLLSPSLTRSQLGPPAQLQAKGQELCCQRACCRAVATSPSGGKISVFTFSRMI